MALSKQGSERLSITNDTQMNKNLQDINKNGDERLNPGSTTTMMSSDEASETRSVKQEPEEYQYPFRSEAQDFIDGDDGRKHPTYRNREGFDKEGWERGTYWIRGNIHPDLFANQAYRSQGKIAPPRIRERVERPPSEERPDCTNCIRKLEVNTSKVQFREVNWNQASSLDQNDDRWSLLDPLAPPHTHRPRRRDKRPSVQTGSVWPAASVESGIQKRWRSNGWPRYIDENTPVPDGFRLHPGRPWTSEDDDELLDLIIEYKEQDFSKIALWAQRTEKQCHARYRHVANLELRDPKKGPWTIEEDNTLRRFVKYLKLTDWHRIAYWCGRTIEDCGKRWLDLEEMPALTPTMRAMVEEYIQSLPVPRAPNKKRRLAEIADGAPANTKLRLFNPTDGFQSESSSTKCQKLRLMAPRPPVNDHLDPGTATATTASSRKHFLEESGIAEANRNASKRPRLLFLKLPSAHGSKNSNRLENHQAGITLDAVEFKPKSSSGIKLKINPPSLPNLSRDGAVTSRTSVKTVKHRIGEEVSLSKITLKFSLKQKWRHTESPNSTKKSRKPAENLDRAIHPQEP